MNQTVNVTRELPNGWWMGEIDGRSGIFPAAYSKKVDSSSKTTHVIGLHDYSSNGDAAKLSFKKGDQFTLLQELEKGWSRGEKDGKVGLFPMSYVRVVSGSDSDNPGPPKPSQPPPPPPKSKETESEDGPPSNPPPFLIPKPTPAVSVTHEEIPAIRSPPAASPPVISPPASGPPASGPPGGPPPPPPPGKPTGKIPTVIAVNEPKPVAEKKPVAARPGVPNFDDELASRLKNRAAKTEEPQTESGSANTIAGPSATRVNSGPSPAQRQAEEREVEKRFEAKRVQHTEPPGPSVLKTPNFAPRASAGTGSTAGSGTAGGQVPAEEITKVKKALITLQSQSKTAIEGMLARIDNQQKEFLKLVSVMREMKQQIADEQRKAQVLEQQNRKLYQDLQVIQNHMKSNL